ncbi:hypothetical protein [Escherichia coli]|uniref:hypothetical protein n=1 Tax=Escherichia coli TaxID=562 RepID=UPI00339C20AA
MTLQLLHQFTITESLALVADVQYHEPYLLTATETEDSGELLTGDLCSFLA